MNAKFIHFALLICMLLCFGWTNGSRMPFILPKFRVFFSMRIFSERIKGALCEGGDILKMKESAFSKVNLATKNEKNTTWVYLTGLLERIIFGIETLPVC